VFLSLIGRIRDIEVFLKHRFEGNNLRQSLFFSWRSIHKGIYLFGCSICSRGKWEILLGKLSIIVGVLMGIILGVGVVVVVGGVIFICRNGGRGGLGFFLTWT
jgi:hypothetical protein